MLSSTCSTRPILLLDELGGYVRIMFFDFSSWDCVSGTAMSSTGAPQGTILAPFLFTLYTVDFKCCHIQKYSDDSTTVACMRKCRNTGV